jgi:hypothetical protein
MKEIQYVKLVMIKRFDEMNNWLTVTLSCHVSKKVDDSVDQHQHNHSLEFLDGIEINSAIKLAAGKEMAKGYTPDVINRNMQGVRGEGNLETLKQAGELRLNREIVYNASRWRKIS